MESVKIIPLNFLRNNLTKNIGISLIIGKIPYIIQILIDIKLPKYLNNVKGKNFLGFPNFQDCCPLCGGVDCPRFLGTYRRKSVITSRGVIYHNIPIARFRCRRRGKKNPTAHKTFSLLPYELIPYSKFSIDFVFDVMTLSYLEEKSQREILDFITVQSDGILCLDPWIFPEFKSYLIQGIDKLLISRNYRELEALLNRQEISLRIKNLLHYLSGRYGSPIRGPCKLSWEFYIQKGSYKSNSEFLWGIPSHYRF